MSVIWIVMLSYSVLQKIDSLLAGLAPAIGKKVQSLLVPLVKLEIWKLVMFLALVRFAKMPVKLGVLVLAGTMSTVKVVFGTPEVLLGKEVTPLMVPFKRLVLTVTLTTLLLACIEANVASVLLTVMLSTEEFEASS